MSAQDPIVVIGAGPAGMNAAKVLVAAGVKPVVIDEAREAGGQIFRRPQFELSRDDKALYGFDARRARQFRSDFAALQPAIDYRPETVVWSAEQSKLYLLRHGQPDVQRWSRLIIATGAMDRIVPTKGWTAPGVFSLGGAQIALKAEASLIGRRVVFVGTGPLLYLVAYQYAKAGAKVGAVLETGRPFADLSLLPDLMAGRSVFARGLYYLGWLRMHGVAVRTDVAPLAVTLDDSGNVKGLSYLFKDKTFEASCDALAIGYGLKAETQTADLLGLDFHFDAQQRQWLPTTDADGRSSRANVYLAGDGLAIRGSEIAAESGRLAASALLKDAGHRCKTDSVRHRRAIDMSARFRKALDTLFPYPSQIAAGIADETIVCRCEGLTAGTVRQAVHASGEGDINRIKAFCRVGMGRCQGRLCGPATAELIAASAGIDIAAVGRLRGQAPIKPVALGTLTNGPT
ncbi:FAD/NAD(P)-binding oxidoreductase [Rhizobium sp. Root73]|uniref:FAD/NAD(P)-dependent oxidoreductase n=1 Tax=unclassified Rhizobium TaxID=2613769 RepID=UPI000725AE9F|nr:MULTISPECIES: FAD/NAD(P)-binding oxidoreductase [unclassified Rhizobium]KQY15065.1 FAD/NAD(P)-binding oxidoreductase [Rhizobium sp. Root1334]KRC06497.1 FAD/NAD(P)-binding oxidoreductase [Rhizobium sp. Root73]